MCLSALSARKGLPPLVYYITTDTFCQQKRTYAKREVSASGIASAWSVYKNKKNRVFLPYFVKSILQNQEKSIKNSHFCILHFPN